MKQYELEIIQKYIEDNLDTRPEMDNKEKHAYWLVIMDAMDAVDDAVLSYRMLEKEGD